MNLSKKHRKRVEENLGLVGIHLRKYVSEIGGPTRLREYDDLFQEGCIALMQAAQTYRAARHGEFKDYALPRIRVAVNHALRRAFSTVRLPLRTGTGKGGSDPQICVSLEESDENRERARRGRQTTGRAPVARRAVCENGDGGGKIMEKVRRAVEAAGRRWIETYPQRRKRGGPADGVCAAVIGRIVAERLTVPDARWRTPLEVIGNTFGLSKATVIRWERQLIMDVRKQLERDGEFAAMRAKCEERE